MLMEHAADPDTLVHEWAESVIGDQYPCLLYTSVNTSGIIYTPCEYNLNKETGRVDYDQMEEVALREKPKMIIGGGSAYSREWDYKRMRRCV